MNNQLRYLCVVMLLHADFIITMYQSPKKPAGLSAQQSAKWDFFHDRCQLVFQSQGAPIVKRFFDTGNCVTTVSDEGKTVLEHAYNNYDPLTKLPSTQQNPMWLFNDLFERGASPHIYYRKDHEVMLRASQERNISVVVAFIKAGADENYVNSTGEHIFTGYDTQTAWDRCFKDYIQQTVLERDVDVILK